MQKKHRDLTGFILPNSNTFLTIIEERKSNGQDVYLQFINKLYQKKNLYQSASQIDPSLLNIEEITDSLFINTKTNKFIYLEKHRILPGHQGGTYDNTNVVLVTFSEHVMAHYLRTLQYGNQMDKSTLNLMLSNNNEERRREIAKLAGQIGGKNAQELFKQQKKGWYNSETQRKLGIKGAASARLKGVGAFDLANLLKAVQEWQKKYQNDSKFRNKMLENLKKGLKTQKELKINIYDSLSQRIRSVNYNGVLIDGKRLASPYTSISISRKGLIEIEYTEVRTYLSEDFF